MDGARYGGHASAGRQRNFVQLTIVNLITAERHLGAMYRKQLSCQCGCKGWCSVQRLFVLARWSLDALANGRWPESNVDDVPWTAADGRRHALAGQPLGFKGSVVYIMTDWEAVASMMKAPSWSHGRFPCPLCNSDAAKLHNYR